jgi:ferredoxin--NADP+ reductase
MFKVVKSRNIAERIYSVYLEAPRIAARAAAGQFVILRTDEKGERFPLTICDWSSDEGWIRLVFQVVGTSTHKLSLIKEGNGVLDVVGPLGRPTPVADYGHVVCVGGGVGIAAIHPICRALRCAENRVTSIIAARTAGLLILEDEMTAVSDELIVATDDGSKGLKGRVTWALEEFLKKEHADLVIAIGPAIMMKFTSAVTRDLGVPTRVSLNSIMLDGTGMCGTCRVEVAGETRFACVDGPEFDGHQVDWDLLLSRLSQYIGEEDISRRLHEEDASTHSP